jgi:hypothetical protein
MAAMLYSLIRVVLDAIATSLLRELAIDASEAPARL